MRVRIRGVAWRMGDGKGCGDWIFWGDDKEDCDVGRKLGHGYGCGCVCSTLDISFAQIPT